MKKTKKPEFEPETYYIVTEKFRMLGKYVKEFAEKVKKHKFWVPPWWADEQTIDVEEKHPKELFPYWDSLFGTSHLLEQEFIIDLVGWFGFDKAKLIIRRFKEDNFHVIKTMRLALNKDGTIKTRTSKPTGRVIKDEKFKPIIEKAKKQSIGQKKIETGWLTKGLKK